MTDAARPGPWMSLTHQADTVRKLSPRGDAEGVAALQALSSRGIEASAVAIERGFGSALRSAVLELSSTQPPEAPEPEALDGPLVAHLSSTPTLDQLLPVDRRLIAHDRPALILGDPDSTRGDVAGPDHEIVAGDQQMLAAALRSGRRLGQRELERHGGAVARLVEHVRRASGQPWSASLELSGGGYGRATPVRARCSMVVLPLRGARQWSLNLIANGLFDAEVPGAWDREFVVGPGQMLRINAGDLVASASTGELSVDLVLSHHPAGFESFARWWATTATGRELSGPAQLTHWLAQSPEAVGVELDAYRSSRSAAQPPLPSGSVLATLTSNLWADFADQTLRSGVVGPIAMGYRAGTDPNDSTGPAVLALSGRVYDVDRWLVEPLARLLTGEAVSLSTLADEVDHEVLHLLEPLIATLVDEGCLEVVDGGCDRGAGPGWEGV